MNTIPTSDKATGIRKLIRRWRTARPAVAVYYTHAWVGDRCVVCYERWTPVLPSRCQGKPAPIVIDREIASHG